MRPKLDPNIWRQVSPLLDSALSLEGEALAGFLTQARADHPHLAGVLEELIAEHGQLRQDNFLASPVASSLVPPVASLDNPSPSEPFAGATVGAYTLEACSSTTRASGSSALSRPRRWRRRARCSRRIPSA